MMPWLAALHAVHTLSAGVWLGGLVFTTVVVSPAFKRMEWEPSERFAVRSEVGRQYSKVARVNLLALLVFAGVDWSMRGWSPLGWSELLAILVVVALAQVHACVAAPRLGRVLGSGDEAARIAALRLTISVSMATLVLSAAIAVLAI